MYLTFLLFSPCCILSFSLYLWNRDLLCILSTPQRLPFDIYPGFLISSRLSWPLPLVSDTVLTSPLISFQVWTIWTCDILLRREVTSLHHVPLFPLLSFPVNLSQCPLKYHREESANCKPFLSSLIALSPVLQSDRLLAQLPNSLSLWRISVIQGLIGWNHH